MPLTLVGQGEIGKGDGLTLKLDNFFAILGSTCLVKPSGKTRPPCALTRTTGAEQQEQERSGPQPM